VVIEALVVIVGFTAASAIASSRDVSFDLDDSPSGTAPMIGVVAFAAIVALLGYGLGLLVRNTPVAVAILILWPLVGESLIGGVLAAAGVDEPFKWMPYQSGIGMGNPDLGNDGNEQLGRVASGLYFLGVTSVVAALGAWVTSRRDA
jgi:ABC-2 type transport system permease protein